MRTFVTSSHVIRLTLPVLLVGLEACATAATYHEFDRSDVYASSYDDVWEATIRTFGDVDIAIEDADKYYGTITTEWFGVKGEDVDCGSPGFGGVYRKRRAKLAVFVREVSDGTHVLVNGEYTAILVQTLASSETDVVCTSRGVLEPKLHDHIRNSLGDTQSSSPRPLS